MEPLNTFGIAVRVGSVQAAELALEVADWCISRKFRVVIDQQFAESCDPSLFEQAKYAGKIEVLPTAVMVQVSNPIITLGGDGTLLGVARYVDAVSPLFIGVNFGTLGFLTEIAPAELFQTLQDVVDGRSTHGSRTMLQTRVLRNGESVYSSQAVNDAVLQKGAMSPLVTYDVTADGREVMRLRADGLIVASPTGSTAYSLAAGGSIVHPSVEAMLVTPICAHALTHRPLILPGNMTIVVTIPEGQGEVFLSVDGQVCIPLTEGDRVEVTRAPTTVSFVRSPLRSYFDILRVKLNWGLPNKGGN